MCEVNENICDQDGINWNFRNNKADLPLAVSPGKVIFKSVFQKELSSQNITKFFGISFLVPQIKYRNEIYALHIRRHIIKINYLLTENEN